MFSISQESLLGGIIITNNITSNTLVGIDIFGQH